MGSHRRPTVLRQQLRVWFLSSSAAEELVGDLLHQPSPSSSQLLAAHLENCRAAERALVDAGFPPQNLLLLSSARRSLEAVERTLEAYQYSADPEVRHIPILRSRALRMLDRARTERLAAVQALPGARWEHGLPSYLPST